MAIKKIITLLLIPLLLIGCSGGNYTASLDVDEATGDITIKVTGFSKSDAKRYRVAIIRGTTIENTIPISPNGKATYSLNQLLEGECYSFNLVNSANEQFISNVTWSTPNNYCTSVSSEEEIDPDFYTTAEENYDKKPYSYTVTFHVRNLDSLSNVTYTIGEKTQTDCLFKGVAPGEYEGNVRSGRRVRNQLIILPEITGPVKPLSRKDVQDVLDQVAKGRLTAGEAREKLCREDIELAAPVDGMKSLIEVLRELEFGAKYGDVVHYSVVGFENDIETGRMVSGTLKLQVNK